MRKFEKVSYEQFKKDFINYDNHEELYNLLQIPKRSTKNAAGYDFISPVDFVLKPDNIIRIPTGIKVRMHDDEVLEIIIRSSLGFKYNIRLCNQAGIIDSDYYNNSDNEGDILLAFHNHGTSDWIVKKGDRIAQGIFLKFLTVDDEDEINEERVGGIGSTDKRRDINE